MTSLEKRLIVLSNLGIRIEHKDGHRWIEDEATEYFHFDYILKKHGILLNNKIYGSLEDALDIIDHCLINMGKGSLEEMYYYDDHEILRTEEEIDKSRIDFVEKGKGGLF